MPRARLLKPSFFVNDRLADIAPLGRLLFQALWCLADREGRLEDAPRRIKVQALPYDDCDVDALLSDLVAHGFIVRYEMTGGRFIQVVNFAKHQSPHVKEQASTIPAPDMPGASPVQEPSQHAISIPLTLNPIPRSLNPIPVSGADAPATVPERVAVVVQAVTTLPGFPPSVTPKVREKAEAWFCRYPELDIGDELRRMDSWLLGKPQRKASLAFVETWLKKADDDRQQLRPGTNGHSGGGGTGPQVRPAGNVGRVSEFDPADPERIRRELRAAGARI